MKKTLILLICGLLIGAMAAWALIQYVVPRWQRSAVDNTFWQVASRLDQGGEAFAYFHAEEVGKAAMTLDASGFAHIAMLVDYGDPTIWKIAYGYWDGSDDFHFQVLQESIVPHYGLFAQPDIVVREDGSVAIAYHHEEKGQILIRVEENDRLGGTAWSASTVPTSEIGVRSPRRAITRSMRSSDSTSRP